MKSHVPLRKAAEVTGLHPNTLRKYADQGKIPVFRLPNGARRFDVSGFVGAVERTVCYCRVSTPKQKADLDRQAAYLAERYPDSEVVRDIGSGLNFKRKGLRSILERAMRGERLTVVVSYRDRLARFGFELVEWLIVRSGGQVVVLHQLDTSPTAELVADLMAVVTVFSSRLHGLRSYKNALKGHFAETDQGTGNTVAVVGGELPVGVQLDGRLPEDDLRNDR